MNEQEKKAYRKKYYAEHKGLMIANARKQKIEDSNAYKSEYAVKSVLDVDSISQPPLLDIERFKQKFDFRNSTYKGTLIAALQGSAQNKA